MAPFGFDVWAFSDTENQATLRNRIDQKSALSIDGEELRVIGLRVAQ